MTLYSPFKPVPYGVPIVPGASYAYVNAMAVGAGSTTTIHMDVNKLIAWPFQVRKAFSAQYIGLSVATSDATESHYFGIYADDGVGMPSTRLSYKSTNTVLSSTGVNWVTMDSAVWLKEGNYWISYVANADTYSGAVRLRGWSQGQAGNCAILPVDAAPSLRFAWQRAYTMAAVPDPWGTVTSEYTTINSIPIIWLR